MMVCKKLKNLFKGIFIKSNIPDGIDRENA